MGRKQRLREIHPSCLCSWLISFAAQYVVRGAAQNRDRSKALRQEARALKEVVAEQTLELRLLKKNMIADGDDRA